MKRLALVAVDFNPDSYGQRAAAHCRFCGWPEQLELERRRVPLLRPCDLQEDKEGNEMTGAEQIAAERQRQIEQEGWTPEHDDEHGFGELLAAARNYMSAVAADQAPGMDWPWHGSWWKPSDDPVRNLVKAGALIAAEIDRQQRDASS